jgi:S1-C subfamily serine protease
LAPIVINNREEIRVNDGKDILDAINTAKSKISTIVIKEESVAAVVGVAVNLASEGVFAAPSGTFVSKEKEYFVVLSDGRFAAVEDRILDPATNMVFFKAKLGNVPLATIGISKDIRPGEKIIALSNSIQASIPKSTISFAVFSQADIQGKVFDADKPSRSFGLQSVSSPLKSGEALVNTKGEVVGVWNGISVLSSDVLKQSVNLYFADSKKITRPSFGFSYQVVTKIDSQLFGMQEGILITEVKRSLKQGERLPAQEAGFLEKDLVVSVDGQSTSEENFLEEILQKYKPGDKIKFSVIRNKEKKDITLTAGELK